MISRKFLGKKVKGNFRNFYTVACFLCSYNVLFMFKNFSNRVWLLYLEAPFSSLYRVSHMNFYFQYQNGFITEPLQFWSYGAKAKMSLTLPTKLCWEHPVLDVFLKQKSTHNVKEEKKLWLLIKCVSETIERGCGFFTQVWSKKTKKNLFFSMVTRTQIFYSLLSTK